jgi:soluble epoxide hydrolase/lipid-phosphate phosphatase
MVASKLANLYPERHLASIFLAVSYAPPNPDQSGEDIIKFVKTTLGQDLFSYLRFLSSEESPQVLSAHVCTVVLWINPLNH